MAQMLAAPLIGSFTVGNALSVGGTLMNIFGGMSQADSMRTTAARNAENARIVAEANQKQLDYAAGQELAAGQHEAEKTRRKAALMLSRAQAVAAASGAGPLDESLMAGIIGEGEREAGFVAYGAEEKAKGLQYRGKVGAYDANAKGRQGIEEANAAADATLLGTFGRAGTSMLSLAPGAPPTVASLGGRTDGYSYYGAWD